jgi:ABC-2 type transport system permease protein
MRKILAMAAKELRQIRRDPLSLLLLIGLPAFMLTLYGFALNFDVRHVALAVQDRDKSAASRDLLASFVNSTYFNVTATPEAGVDLAGLTERRVAKAVLVIPEGFGADLAAGRTAKIQLLVDGADSMTATTILGYVGALVAEANVRVLSRTLRTAGLRLDAGIDYAPRVWYNPELQSTRFLVPGLIGLLMMLIGVLATALSVVREKERGTMEQLRVAPIANLQVILGKTLPYMAIVFLATVFILIAARLLFAVEVKGPYLDLFLAVLAYLSCALGLGLVISSIADTQALAFQVSLLTSLLPSMLLSGFIFQIRMMPVWLQAITYLVPARYFLVILRGIILKGSGLGPYLREMGFLLLFATVMLALALVRLEREGRAQR